MASGHVCSSFVDMFVAADYRASHEIQHTYLTRAPTQPDAICGTAGMSSVYCMVKLQKLKARNAGMS